MSDALQQACEAYVARRDRRAHPDGEFDSAGRWYPSDAEWQACCNRIRPPSRAYPYSLLVHCRTIEHVARVYGVDARALRRATSTRKPAQRLGGENYYKAVAMLPDGRLVSIYDGTTEYVLGQTLVQRVRRGHRGGYYVYDTLADARRAPVPPHAVYAKAPRAILRVRAEGQYTSYPCPCTWCHDARAWQDVPPHAPKRAFSRVTPLEVVEIVQTEQVAASA